MHTSFFQSRSRALQLIFIGLAALMPWKTAAQTEDTFEQYFQQAQAFADAWPQEKVYMHFDNTSYYQGDTIWYKAYVVKADKLQPTNISKPLYVELVDQLGNIHERQILKIENGCANGQISLAKAFFTGYYEVRAYTKWMLAFDDEPLYFSRTFPIYRKRLSANDSIRSIANYKMDDSMKQRPKEKLQKLNANFYPEGGQLVKGVPSVVGFETLSSDSGWVDVNGFLIDQSGQKSMPVATIHDGMGSFLYTPSGKDDYIELNYSGKAYKFKMPAAEKTGFVMRVNNRKESLDVDVMKNQETAAEPLMVYVSAGERPCSYIPLTFEGNASKHIRIMTDSLPAGVVKISLININGKTLADRFCFVYPKQMPQLEMTSDKNIYTPYEAVECKIKLTDNEQKPLANTDISVAVCDGMDMDYRAYDHNIMTDLLLCSDIKGYINRPGYYFVDQSTSRRKLLDNLMLIRGWRKYDQDMAFGLKAFTPKQLPEDRLTLYGQVKSWFGNKRNNVGVTILAQNDSLNVIGTTFTDSLGYFQVPIDDFSGEMQSTMQTRREGKRYNLASSVQLFRNFEPSLRTFDYEEVNPKWDEPKMFSYVTQTIDSLNNVGIDGKDVQILDEVVVSARRKRKKLAQETEAFERHIVAFYNIRQIVDHMRDDGINLVDDMHDLLYRINPGKINREGTTYGTADLHYGINGRSLSDEDAAFMMRGIIDHVETALLYQDQFGRKSYQYDTENFRVKEEDMNDFFNQSTFHTDTISLGNVKGSSIRCNLTMDERWDANRNYLHNRGMRRTIIQGYNPPAEFYSPSYPDIENILENEDTRRTLYWNPDVVTDENGEAKVTFYNGRNTTFLDIKAETLVDGVPVGINVDTIGDE